MFYYIFCCLYGVNGSLCDSKSSRLTVYKTPLIEKINEPLDQKTNNLHTYNKGADQ